MTMKIDCGACHGCCHQLVILLPDDKPLPLTEETPFGKALQRRPDGACVYLDGLLGCLIYEQRPTICREFHCGLWFQRLPPEAKRAIEIEGNRQDKQMLRSGAKHAQSA